MTEPKLKPCPFCGGKDVYPDTDGCMTWVICISCGSRGKRFFNGREALKKASDAWNRRANDDND